MPRQRRQVLFLRGINLGSHKRISMPELRAVLDEAGFESVRTYVQSGNVVLSSGAPPDELGRECEALLAKQFGFDVDIVVRTRDELAEIVRLNPLGEIALEPKRYQVTVLEHELDEEIATTLASLEVAPERLVYAGRELYTWHPDGIGRSRLWARVGGKRLGVVGTARNWTTVENLLAMADEE
jgi:uncharacterized protein (DUF1697 family)